MKRGDVPSPMNYTPITGKPLAASEDDSPEMRSWQNGGMERDSPMIAGRSIDRARLAEICRRFGIEELAVFGSVARGEASPESDIDLLYVARPDARLGFSINRLEDELADLFGRRVDLVSRKALHRMLCEQVEKEARTLYAA